MSAAPTHSQGDVSQNDDSDTHNKSVAHGDAHSQGDEQQLSPTFEDSAKVGDKPVQAVLKYAVEKYMMGHEAEAEELLDAWKNEAVAAAEKAYGGCHNCYGKGYATVNEYSSGYATDGDIGGPEGYFKWKNNPVKFCTCDRGKQLAALSQPVTKEQQKAHQD